MSQNQNSKSQPQEQQTQASKVKQEALNSGLPKELIKKIKNKKVDGTVNK
jgi:hypothetical protein